MQGLRYKIAKECEKQVTGNSETSPQNGAEWPNKFCLSRESSCGHQIPPSALQHLPWAAERWNKQLLKTEPEQYNSKMEVMLAIRNVSFLHCQKLEQRVSKGKWDRERNTVIIPTNDFSRDRNKQKLTPYYSLSCYCVPVLTRTQHVGLKQSYVKWGKSIWWAPWGGQKIQKKFLLCKWLETLVAVGGVRIAAAALLRNPLVCTHFNEEKWTRSLLSQGFLLYVHIHALPFSNHFRFCSPF